MDPISVLQSRIEQLEAKLGIMPSSLDANDSQAGESPQHVSELAPAPYLPEQTQHKHSAPHAYHHPVNQMQPQYQAHLAQQYHNKTPHEVHLQHENQAHTQHAAKHSVPQQHVSHHLTPATAHQHAVPAASMHQLPVAASAMYQQPVAASPMHQHAIPASPKLPPAPHCQHTQAQQQYQNQEHEHYHQHDARNSHQHGDSVTANLVNVANTINSAVAGHEKLASAMQQATELNNYMDPNLMENIEKSKLHMNEVVAAEPILKHHCQCMHRYKQATPAMESEAIAQVPQMQSTLDNMHAGIASVKTENDNVSAGIQQLAESCGAAAMRGSERLAAAAEQVDLLEQRNRKRNGLDDY